VFVCVCSVLLLLLLLLHRCHPHRSVGPYRIKGMRAVAWFVDDFFCFEAKTTSIFIFDLLSFI
jgi:hypothetical protein